MTEEQLKEYIDALQSQRAGIASDGAKNVAFRGRVLGRFTLMEIDQAIGHAQTELGMLLRDKAYLHPVIMHSPYIHGNTSPTIADITAKFGLSDNDVPEVLKFTEDGVVGTITRMGIQVQVVRFAVAAYQGSKYWLLARLASEDDITLFVLESDTTDQNQFVAFTKHSSTLNIGGDDYTIWISIHDLTNLTEDIAEVK